MLSRELDTEYTQKTFLHSFSINEVYYNCGNIQTAAASKENITSITTTTKKLLWPSTTHTSDKADKNDDNCLFTPFKTSIDPQ